MNGNGRDAVVALGICTVVCVAMVITHSADVLWLLVLLVLLAFVAF